MWRWLFVLALACGRLNSPPDASIQPAQCEANFEAQVDRTCVANTDCILVPHPDCCGPVEIGVSQNGFTAAGSAEGPYEACENGACGARGCAHQDQAEDGLVPGVGQAIIPVCGTGNRCTSTVGSAM